MKYVYRDLSKRTKDYKEIAELKSFINTNLPLDKVLEKTDLNENEKAFVDDYRNKLPITENGSTMNRLCHIAEQLFKRVEQQKKDKSIDFIKILSSGFGKMPNNTKMKELRELYEQ